MDTSVGPIVAIASGAIASRLILTAGMKRLTVEEKGRIVEALTPFHTWSYIALVGIVAGSMYSPWILVLGLPLYLLALVVGTWMKLSNLSLSSSYLRTHYASHAALAVGILVCLVLYL